VSTLDAALNASASALTAERTRIEVAVSNMANAESTRGADGHPYRRRDVILTPTPDSTFDAAMSNAGVVGVQVSAVVEDTAPFRRRYDPSHPDADGEGFVEMPNVDSPTEMVDMLSATRAYQANLTAIGMIREVVQKALELGK
jgi:flagellar basal-body rod protein FlgC